MVDIWGIMVINNVINGDLWLFYGLWMILIPINTIFRGLFTSINPSYFDVNKKGVQGFDTLPYNMVNNHGNMALMVIMVIW
jgi:hypothetical protein